MIYFDAPWGSKLKLMTTIAVIVFLGIPAWSWLNSTAPSSSLFGFIPLLLPGAVAIPLAYLFSIRRYGVSSTEIVVERLIGNKHFPIADLNSIEFDPTLTNGSLRTFGNGGFFSFSGNFRNARLGSYRAYVMDHDRLVALYFQNSVVVVSPDNPAGFVDHVNTLLHS